MTSSCRKITNWFPNMCKNYCIGKVVAIFNGHRDHKLVAKQNQLWSERITVANSVWLRLLHTRSDYIYYIKHLSYFWCFPMHISIMNHFLYLTLNLCTPLHRFISIQPAWLYISHLKIFLKHLTCLYSWNLITTIALVMAKSFLITIYIIGLFGYCKGGTSWMRN